mmetsp:Transcript_5527/g.6384  ORF Transcript_5527/g.6384 Transcript_5527/m.6384 type:complete len:101 (+) Transcript_5527:90-392(+)
MKGLFVVALLAVIALSSAFAPSATFSGRVASISTTELEACRTNAKKEKRLRNRDNMRKFKKRGRTSRKKMMRKVAASEMRQLENEFIAKCFTTVVEEESK